MDEKKTSKTVKKEPIKEIKKESKKTIEKKDPCSECKYVYGKGMCSNCVIFKELTNG